MKAVFQLGGMTIPTFPHFTVTFLILQILLHYHRSSKLLFSTVAFAILTGIATDDLEETANISYILILKVTFIARHRG